MINYECNETESNYTESIKLQYRKYLQFSYNSHALKKQSKYKFIFIHISVKIIMYYIYNAKDIYNTVLYVFKMWCAAHEVFRYKIEI